MKYFIILIVVVVSLSGIIYLLKGGGPTEDLVVETYFHSLEVPDWTPMGLAYEAQEKIPPVYLQLRNMRHFVVVVNVPAERLLSVDQTSAEPEVKPEAGMEPEARSGPQPEKGNDYMMSDGRGFRRGARIPGATLRW